MLQTTSQHQGHSCCDTPQDTYGHLQALPITLFQSRQTIHLTSSTHATHKPSPILADPAVQPLDTPRQGKRRHLRRGVRLRHLNEVMTINMHCIQDTPGRRDAWCAACLSGGKDWAPRGRRLAALHLVCCWPYLRSSGPHRRLCNIFTCVPDPMKHTLVVWRRR